MRLLLADDIGIQLLHGILSWEFLQFIVAFLSILASS